VLCFLLVGHFKLLKGWGELFNGSKVLLSDLGFNRFDVFLDGWTAHIAINDHATLFESLEAVMQVMFNFLLQLFETSAHHPLFKV
jgi:hypothetical protein